jgi:hypothetical protein
LCWRIETQPKYESSYDRSTLIVSITDFAQLGIRHYKRGAARPTKSIDFPRQHISTIDGVPVARKIIVRSIRRGTETTADVEEIVLNPQLPNSLFSTTALEVNRDIPDL